MAYKTQCQYYRRVPAVSIFKCFALAVPHERAIEIQDDVGFFQAVRAALLKSAGGEKKKSAEEMDHAIPQIISRASSPRRFFPNRS